MPDSSVMGTNNESFEKVDEIISTLVGARAVETSIRFTSKHEPGNADKRLIDRVLFVFKTRSSLLLLDMNELGW